MSGLFKISIASTGRRGWKDTFYVTAEISTEGHFLSLFCQLMVVECVPCTLSFSVLFSVFFLLPLPPCSFLCRLIGRSRLKCHPALPAQPHIVISLPPPPSSRRASLLIRQGYLGGPSPSKKPSTVTQKWTPPAVRGVKGDALKKDAGKLFNQIRSLYTMKCGVSAVHALEPAEIGALLLIKYKLVFNRILFQEVCDYLAVDWPTVSAHFKAGNSRELCAALC